MKSGKAPPEGSKSERDKQLAREAEISSSLKAIDRLIMSWNPCERGTERVLIEDDVRIVDLDNIQTTCGDQLQKYEAIRNLYEQIKVQETVLLTDHGAKFRREQAIKQTKHLL